MRKLFVLFISLMMFTSLTSCETPAYAVEPVETVVVTNVPTWTFYWVFENGRYYRRECTPYYSRCPYYWGGPRKYYHRNWRPIPPRPYYRPYYRQYRPIPHRDNRHHFNHHPRRR